MPTGRTAPPSICCASWRDGSAALRLLFVVTYRDDELGPAHPLRLVLGDLATAPTVHRICLPPLSEDAVRELARDSGRDAGELHRLTGGNPFFLTEVLAAAGDGVPSTVGDAVLARAGRLSPEARAVLEVAAVIGSLVDLDLLTEIAGPVVDETDESIAVGLLRAAGDGIAFRHELAREAVLAAIAPPRRRLLHARVLATLRESTSPDRDPALLAHHAEGAGDGAAVLEFALAAAEQAAALHAHREAAAQYARALRHGDGLDDAARAGLLERRSLACFISDQGVEAIGARLDALAIWRRLGDRPKEGENRRWLSRLYWFEGRGAEAEAAGFAALEVLEALPPGPQLAMAYSNLSQLRMLADDFHGALTWGERAIRLAERLGETETLAHALTNVGTARLDAGDDRGREELERSHRLSRDAGLLDHACRALTNLAWSELRAMRLDAADRRLATAIDYATAHDLDNYHWYLLATRAVVRFRRGEWDEADAETRHLLRRPALSPLTKIVALTTRGQLLARRGDPEAATTLDEALALAERTGQLLRLGPVRAARAEAALLTGDRTRAMAEIRPIRDLAFRRGNPWLKGELAWLTRCAGTDPAASIASERRSRDGTRPGSASEEHADQDIAEPYALQFAGAWVAAAAAWDRLGCPYEAAMALLEGDDEAGLRQAFATFDRLGARPAAALASRRLRRLGAVAIPRGPRASTRSNSAGLTRREAEVLALVAAGLSNGEIADRLYLTPKTVGHHVSAVLAKLGVASRAEAALAAARLGIGAA